MNDFGQCVSGFPWEKTEITLRRLRVAAAAEWSRYRIVAGLVMSSSPLKTRRVGKRCKLNLSGAQTSSRWCGVISSASSSVVFVTWPRFGSSPKALV
ncbi:uncharacterized protein TNCV_3370571 [Trichonephila clavipes]|nr:uncharacterized protein TNCV_3370571 [Trichonephila clavipes]